MVLIHTDPSWSEPSWHQPRCILAACRHCGQSSNSSGPRSVVSPGRTSEAKRCLQAPGDDLDKQISYLKVDSADGVGLAASMGQCGSRSKPAAVVTPKLGCPFAAGFPAQGEKMWNTPQRVQICRRNLNRIHPPPPTSSREHVSSLPLHSVLIFSSSVSS